MVLRVHDALSQIVINLRRDGMQTMCERVYGQSHTGRYGSLTSFIDLCVVIAQRSPYPGTPQALEFGIAPLHFTAEIQQMISQ